MSTPRRALVRPHTQIMRKWRVHYIVQHFERNSMWKALIWSSQSDWYQLESARGVRVRIVRKRTCTHARGLHAGVRACVRVDDSCLLHSWPRLWHVFVELIGKGRSFVSIIAVLFRLIVARDRPSNRDSGLIENYRPSVYIRVPFVIRETKLSPFLPSILRHLVEITKTAVYLEENNKECTARERSFVGFIRNFISVKQI